MGLAKKSRDVTRCTSTPYIVVNARVAGRFDCHLISKAWTRPPVLTIKSTSDCALERQKNNSLVPPRNRLCLAASAITQFSHNTPMSGRSSSVEKAFRRALRIPVSQKNTFLLRVISLRGFVLKEGSRKMTYVSSNKSR